MALISAYSFEWNANDLVAGAFNGTVTGTPPNNPSIQGKAYSFTTNWNYITTAHNDNIVTLNCWTNVTANNGYAFKQASAGWEAYFSWSSTFVCWTNWAARIIEAPLSSLVVNTWQMYTVVINGTSSKIFIDWVEKTPRTMTLNGTDTTLQNSTWSLYIGNYSTWNIPIKWQIDEIKFDWAQWTTADVKNQYSSYKWYF